MHKYYECDFYVTSIRAQTLVRLKAAWLIYAVAVLDAVPMSMLISPSHLHEQKPCFIFRGKQRHPRHYCCPHSLHWPLCNAIAFRRAQNAFEKEAGRSWRRCRGAAVGGRTLVCAAANQGRITYASLLAQLHQTDLVTATCTQNFGEHKFIPSHLAGCNSACIAASCRGQCCASLLPATETSSEL